MEYIDLYKILINVLLPSSLFIGLGFLAIYGTARYIGKLHVEGQGVLIASFAVLGGILGVSVGASRSPELGAILPALLTVITFLLGYLFSREHLSEWRPIIPYCILVLLLNSFYGLFVGSTIRGKHENFVREHQKRLLYYEKVELEVEKAKQLKQLDEKVKTSEKTGQVK